MVSRQENSNGQSEQPEGLILSPILLSAERIEQFRSAVGLKHDLGVPATLSTIFRDSEFAWVKRMGIEMRELVHTEQEYEYFSPFETGESAVAVTTVKRRRERSGLLLITLETRIV